jgi:hypothetical protein
MRIRVGLVMVALVAWTAGAARAQECETFRECMAGMCQNGGCVAVPLNSGPCDDFQECTTNDTCVNGECQGTPAAGGACNDFNDCSTGDVCTDLFGTIVCMGATPVEEGTPCTSNCGTCLPSVPVAGAPLQCKPDPERLNAPCTPPFADNPCVTGQCRAQGPVGFQFAVCFPMAKTCPDEDGNPCTGEFCNPENGECDVAPVPVDLSCFPPECHRCVPETGECVPNNIGGSCDDLNACTGSTVCSAEGGCVAGVLQPTVTPTRTSGGSTATPTGTFGQGTPTNTVAGNTPTPTGPVGTATPTPTQGACVGDCDQSGDVKVNELVLGVNIALDRADLDECPEFDRNASNGVEVNELVSGVNSLLRGCL